jgi:phage I-like protein
MTKKFPADFERCVRQGGRVRTISGPNKEHGLSKDEYVKYCYKDGKSYRGEVKTKSKKNTEPRKVSFLIDVSGKDFSETTEIEVLHSGVWEHPQYGAIRISEQDIDKFIDSFKTGVRKVDLAVDQEHMPEKGAAGWFKELWKEREYGKAKLKAKVDWTPVGEELISNGIFKYFSPEFDFEYEDPETQEVYNNVLIGGALTNRPYFKDLSPVQLSENVYAGFNDSNKKGGEERMLTKEELKSKLEADSEFELSEDASDEERKLFEEVKSELSDGGEEQEEGDEPEEEEEKDEEIKASERFISKAEHAKRLNELKSQLGIVEKKLKFKEVREDVRGYVFSESNPDGVLLPKNEELATNILMSANSKTAKLFKEFLKELPAVSKKLFEEQGTGEGEGSDDVQARAMELVEEGKAKTYSEAVKLLSRKEPELFEDK